MPAIETFSLRKDFGAKTAVRGLTLTVEQGEAFGFLGPNGAGKTTSIKMMLGLVAPTAGQARLLDEPLGSRAARAKMGFLPEHFRFHDWLTAVEFLTLHGQLYGVERAVLNRRIGELLERVGLSEFGKAQLRTFSKGMLQRIGLAQALLNQPRLVFLDEPTSGLDPVGRRLVRDVIRELRETGTTVFLNSHLLSEVEITCDRVAFIKHGEVLKTADLKTLMAGSARVTIRTGGVPPVALDAVRALAAETRLEGETLHLALAGEAQIPQVLRALHAEQVDVFAVTPETQSLEEMFIQIVGTDGGL